MKSHSAVKALGEVALRVNDLQLMKRVYQDGLGLEVFGEVAKLALLMIADGYGGHTQVLGLFDRSVRVGQEHTTVDHIAFTIALADFDSEKKRLEALGLKVETENHHWVKWRSLYVRDPEGNLVELVCYDENLGQ